MPANNIKWTPAMEERLLQLAEKGLYYSQCAEILSREFGKAVTKNACIGKGRRMQVPLRMPARKGKAWLKKRSQNPERKLRRSEKRRRADASLREQKTRQLRHRRDRKPHPTRNLTLLQLRPRSCRWPSGEMPNVTFCGDTQAASSSYCLKHTLIARPSYGKV